MFWFRLPVEAAIVTAGFLEKEVKIRYNMTVQELIDELNNIDDKSKHTMFPNNDFIVGEEVEGAIEKENKVIIHG